MEDAVVSFSLRRIYERERERERERKAVGYDKSGIPIAHAFR